MFEHIHSANGTEARVGSPALEMAPGADWSHMGRHDHFVQIYEADDVLVRSVAEYVIHGIKAGATCVVVATPEHRAGIKQLVTKFAANLSAHGQYVELDARECLAEIFEFYHGHFSKVLM